MLKITVIIHTRDSETTLPRLLESIQWAEERIVVDMESHDRTCEIARQNGATLFSTPVVARIDGIRNHFLERGKHEWVFVLDSDEIWQRTRSRWCATCWSNMGKAAMRFLFHATT